MKTTRLQSTAAPVASPIADARLAARIAARWSDFTKIANVVASIAVKKRHAAIIAVGRKWLATAESSGAATSTSFAPVAELSCPAAVRAAARCSRAWA